MNLEILCYKNNKIVYEIEITMNEKKIKQQIKKGILTYFNVKKGIEIINLRCFDKVIIRDLMNWEEFC